MAVSMWTLRTCIMLFAGFSSAQVGQKWLLAEGIRD